MYSESNEENINPCGGVLPCGCDEIDFCGCDEKVDLECTFYSGEELIPLGITSGMDGNLIIKIINEYIKTHPGGGNTGTPVRFQNVGNKSKVYKGISTSNKHELRTIEGTEGSVVEEEEDTINIKADPDWFKNLLTEEWFSVLIKNLFNTSTFQGFFATYITNLFTNGNIDICDLIAACDIAPADLPPSINGDIVYNRPNRGSNFSLNPIDFTSKYSDPEGDAFESIKITGGNVTGLVKSNSTAVNIGDVIPISEVSQIKYNSPNQNSASTQIVNYVAINVKGQQSN